MKRSNQPMIIKLFITTLYVLNFWISSLHAQQPQKDSIQRYFYQIESLINLKEQHPFEFLDGRVLTIKKNHSKGKEKVAVLLLLFKSYIYKSTDKATAYNIEALQLANNINYEEGALQAQYNQAYLLFVQGKFDAALALVQEIEQEASFSNYPNIFADISTLKSDIFTERGAYDVALETGIQLLDMAEKTNNKHALMRAYAALSHTYLRLNNYNKALSYCLKGLHYIIDLKRTEYFFPKIDEIARMTAHLKDKEAALEAYNFYQQMESKANPPGPYIQSIVYMNMANIYLENQQLNKSQHYIAKALHMNYKYDYRFRTPRALMIQAELFLKQKDTANAITYYEKSLAAADQIDAYDVMKVNSNILALLYNNSGNTAKAKAYERQFAAINDSLFNNEKEHKIAILEAKQNIKEVTQKKDRLELLNKIQTSKYNIVFLILLCLIVLSSLATYAYLKVKNKNLLLNEKAQALAKEQELMSKKLNTIQKTNKPKPAMTFSLDDDVKNIILTKLDKLEQQHFFLDPNCNLHLLSEQLKTNAKYVSQVINQEKKANFNNYINALRVNYLLPKLINDAEFRNNKLSYIAISVGFNNLNTFNTAFKKRKGMLPSCFIQTLNEEQNALSKQLSKSVL